MTRVKHECFDVKNITVDIEQECLDCKIMALDVKHEQLDVTFSYLTFCHIWPSIGGIREGFGRNWGRM